jgi:hypothetical protein
MTTDLELAAAIWTAKGLKPLTIRLSKKPFLVEFVFPVSRGLEDVVYLYACKELHLEVRSLAANRAALYRQCRTVVKTGAEVQL